MSVIVVVFETHSDDLLMEAAAIYAGLASSGLFTFKSKLDVGNVAIL